MSGQKYDATDGELSGGVLSGSGILEHSTNGTNSKHQESSLVHITRDYRIMLVTPLALLVCMYTRVGGAGVIVWNGKSGD
jgi:hypothetical protein